MTAAAVSRWLADHLSGADTLLIATTNAQAAELARRARYRLAALGRTGTGEPVELADGTLAGPGDLLMARNNEHIMAGSPGGGSPTATCCCSKAGPSGGEHGQRWCGSVSAATR